MSKSVLVIDTPGSCMGCNFFICDGDTNMDSCMARETAKSVDLEKYDKPDWCPLKPLPEKMKVTGLYNGEYFKAGGKPPSYKIGWNACIDAIAGES